MFCNKCGAKLPDDAKFCNACGNKTESPVKPAVLPKKPSLHIGLLIIGILSFIGAFITMFMIPVTLAVLNDEDLFMPDETETTAVIFVLLSVATIIVGILQGIGCVTQKKGTLKLAEVAAIISLILSVLNLIDDFRLGIGFGDLMSFGYNIAVSVIILSLILKQIDKIESYKRDLFRAEHAEEIKIHEEQIKESLTETDHLDIQEGYKPAEVEGKFFVTKDGEEENLYCPKCYKKVSKSSSSCNECNRNFYKKFF